MTSFLFRLRFRWPLTDCVCWSSLSPAFLFWGPLAVAVDCPLPLWPLAMVVWFLVGILLPKAKVDEQHDLQTRRRKGLVFGDKKNRGSWLQIPILLYTLFTTVSGKETELKKTDDSRGKSVEIVSHCDAISKPNAKTKRKESMRFLREYFRCWAKFRFQNMLEWVSKLWLGAQKYLTKIKISWNSKWREICDSVVKQWRRRHFSLHGWPGQVCRPLYRHKLTWNSRKPEDLSSLIY